MSVHVWECVLCECVCVCAFVSAYPGGSHWALSMYESVYCVCVCVLMHFCLCVLAVLTGFESHQQGFSASPSLGLTLPHATPGKAAWHPGSPAYPHQRLLCHTPGGGTALRVSGSLSVKYGDRASPSGLEQLLV